MENYLLNFILSCFSEADGVKISQLIHILNGKRTPSVFNMTMHKHLIHVYGLLPHLKREKLIKAVNALTKDGYLYHNDEKYYLTEKGAQQIAYFYEHYPYPCHIHTFSYTLIRKAIWLHVQLLTQIASQWSYQQKQFSPLIWDEKVQANVKCLVQRYEKFHDIWQDEQIQILETMDLPSADFLANWLSGYDSWGLTFDEMEEYIPGGKWTVYIWLQDAIEQYMTIAQKLDLSLHQHMLQLIWQTYYAGLSPSTFQSIQCIARGISLEEIAQRRHLKLNTIREHVLETAFVHPEYAYQRLIDKERYRELNELFEENDELTYKEAKEILPDLIFMDYRLVELERWQNED